MQMRIKQNWWKWHARRNKIERDEIDENDWAQIKVVIEENNIMTLEETKEFH
jgi:hypothetical protein